MKYKYPLIKPVLDEDELREIRKVFESGWLTQGPFVEEFEHRIANYVKAKYAVAVTSCTTALYLSIKALGLRNEIIIPDFTFPATGNAVVEAGADLVLADVNEESYGLDFELVRRNLSKNVSAVIVVHPFGYPLDLKPLRKLSEEEGFYVIEDAATALGSIREGRYAGNMGHIGCYSFHPRKLLTTGEGGMIVLNDEEVYERLLMLRDHGRDKQGKFVVHSLNFRMPDILAAIGIVQLEKLEATIERRRKLASIYNGLFRDILPQLRTPKEDVDCRSTYQSYVVGLPREYAGCQTAIISKLRKHGIEAQIGTYALHLEPVFANYKRIGTLEVAERLTRTTITLPLYNELEYEDIEYIVYKFKEILSSC
ncbi:MAG: DegT/DnrJ/EryC1/StrS family aminotransferase [Desulfurococcaceae archaeon]